jgi:hypothetical protein
MDANIQKLFKIPEPKSLCFRMDLSNVFNHPNPVNPSIDLNAGTFGEINNKTGNCSLVAQVRFQFQPGLDLAKAGPATIIVAGPAGTTWHSSWKCRA